MSPEPGRARRPGKVGGVRLPTRRRSGGGARPAAPSGARRVEEDLAGEELTLRIGEPAHGGACVARDEGGRVIFVRHTLPGELVRARVTRTRKKLAWAETVEVLQASPDRVPSVWPQAGPFGVGGGELAHVLPEAQRRWKAEVLRGQLRRVGGPALFDQVESAGGVEVWAAPGDAEPDDQLLGRRTRIEVVVDAQGRAGMHGHRAHEVVALDSMPLAVPEIQDLGLFEASSPWRSVWRPGERVRIVSPNEGGAVVVTPTGVFDASGELTQPGPLTWTVSVAGREHRYGVRPTGFWQTHRMGAQVLAGAVLEAAGSAVATGASVMELYSGAGLFSSVLAAGVGESGHVFTLEGDEGAVADAGANTEEYPQVQTYAGDVDRQGVLDLAAEVRDAGVSRPDVVVLDPPRAGAGREVCLALGEVGAGTVVLVACDPAAGSRDMAMLLEAGYRVGRVWAWDLFPHTHHVEFVAALHRS